MGNENFTAAPSGTFRTGDGVLNISANEQKQFETLCDLVGRPDLKTDPRFSEREARKAARAALTGELEAALASRPARDWETLLNEHGVPAGQVLTIPQILAEPHVAGRDFVETLDATGSRGRLRITRPGFRLETDYPAPQPPPRLGADTRRWLSEIGYTASAIDALSERGVVGSEERRLRKECVRTCKSRCVPYH